MMLLSNCKTCSSSLFHILASHPLAQSLGVTLVTALTFGLCFQPPAGPTTWTMSDGCPLHFPAPAHTFIYPFCG